MHRFFLDKLPQQDSAHFQAVIEEVKLVTRTALQSAIDAAETSSRLIIAIVMH